MENHPSKNGKQNSRNNVFDTSNSFEESAIIAYVLLFSSGDELRLDHLDGFEDIRLMNEIIFDSYITSTDNDFEIRNLVEILRKMGMFCTYNFDWDALSAEHAEISISNVAMNFTIEEEAWLEHQGPIF
jgi:hypothetical protein